MNCLKSILYWAVFFLMISSCTQKKTGETQKPTRVVQVPVFNSDSAYRFVEKQVSFGPRVPNSNAHQQTSEFFITQFKKFGATVIAQDFQALTWDNQQVQLKNIIATYNPQAKKR